jgi:hypothetical protein
MSKLTCNFFQDRIPTYSSLYDWNECGRSHVLNAIYMAKHRLADSKWRRERRVCFTTSAREGKLHFSFTTTGKKGLEDKGSTPDAEVNLEAGDGLRREKCTWRREVNFEEMWTWKREAHYVDTGEMRT